MSDVKNICEEIEISIYSDSVLTDEQKKHIDSCENCKALLSQVTRMKKDLVVLSVPGINEGDICKSVMNRIKVQKSHVSFPKFKLTHHLGTAAAIVIVLAAAFAIKNPSDTLPNASGTIDDSIKESEYIQVIPKHVMFSQNNNSGNDYFESETLTTGDLYDDSDSERAKIKFSVHRTANITSDISEEETEIIPESTPNYDVSTNVSPSSELCDELEKSKESIISENNTQTINGAIAKNGKSETDPDAPVLKKTASSGGSGGGSSARPLASQDTNEEVIVNELFADYEESTDGFDGYVSATLQDSFDNSIYLINEQLKELYGNQFILSKEKLIANNIDNEKLTELFSDISSYDKLIQISNTFDIFE